MPGAGKKDWLHLNTIQLLPDGSAIVSSRETSTAIKLDSLETDPSIDYMIGQQSFWKNTAFAQYLLAQDGDAPATGGQHTITYERDPSLPDGQYYLYMFDNNYGMSNTRPDYDWGANNADI
nr:aryl-sulfate sulfotransferase [Bifidobacterium sp.]